MARLYVPLVHRRFVTTGDDVIHAELILELKTNRGTWEEFVFIVDPGTEMTTMPAELARMNDLPIPGQPVRGLSFRGQEVRRGRLRARIPGLDATEYVFPCYFLGAPHAPIVDPKNLLGLTGVGNQIRLLFEGTTSPSVRFGHLIVEKI